MLNFTNLTKKGPLFNQASTEAEQLILKIDIEGYECKALPEDVIMGSSGKWIPFIFLEWGQLVSWTSIQLLTKKDIILILCLRPSLKSNSLRHRQVDDLRHVLHCVTGAVSTHDVMYTGFYF